MNFDDRKHIIVSDLSEELFNKVIAYGFYKYSGLGGLGCVLMITQDAEELQLSGKELNSLDFYTEWSNLFPVLRFFTYDGCNLDFTKPVKHWHYEKGPYGEHILVKKSIYQDISEAFNELKYEAIHWDDILLDYVRTHPDF